MERLDELGAERNDDAEQNCLNNDAEDHKPGLRFILIQK